MFKNYKLHATLILLFADNFRIQQTKQQNLRVIEHLWALLLARHPRIQLTKQQNLRVVKHICALLFARHF